MRRKPPPGAVPADTRRRPLRVLAEPLRLVQWGRSRAEPRQDARVPGPRRESAGDDSDEMPGSGNRPPVAPETETHKVSLRRHCLHRGRRRRADLSDSAAAAMLLISGPRTVRHSTLSVMQNRRGQGMGRSVGKLPGASRPRRKFRTESAASASAAVQEKSAVMAREAHLAGVACTRFEEILAVEVF